MSSTMEDAESPPAMHLSEAIVSLLEKISGNFPLDLEKCLAQVEEHKRNEIREFYNIGIGFCESPIERKLFPWLITQRYQFFDKCIVLSPPNDGKPLEVARAIIAIVPQLRIGTRRCDFALIGNLGGHSRAVIIECDGEEFHKDVYKDIGRDAELLRHNRILDVVSITGKEIYRDSEKAARIASKAVLDAWAKTSKHLDRKFR